MKNKKVISRVIVLSVIAVIVILVTGAVSVSAASTGYYRTYGESYKTNGNEPPLSGPPACFDIYMYGDYVNTSYGTLYDGAIINWNYVNVYLDAHEEHDRGIYFYLKRGNIYECYKQQNELSGGDKMLYSGRLPDGKYILHYLSSYEKHILFVSWTVEYVYNFNFTVDTTPPTITGASTSTDYKNGSFTVSASDAMTGVRALYYKKPGQSAYTSTTSGSVVIPAGSTAGLYSFYAVDNAGNSTIIHYVYYDGTNPLCGIYNTSGTSITGSYTNQSFYFSAVDQYSGIKTVQYKKPGSSSWLSYTSGTTIPASSTDGYYQFKATDKSGNSVTKGIYLDSTAPTCTLYADNTVVDSGSSVYASNTKFNASDATSGLAGCYVKKPGSSSYVSYVSDTKLTGYGTYYFYCVDNAGNTSEIYSVTLLPSGTGGSGGSGSSHSETYTVSYNANGGTGAPASQTKTKDVALTLTTAQPTRTGYTFIGWSTSPYATSAEYTSGSLYRANASVTLYAVWSQRSYSVTYNANGGSGAPSSQVKYYGTSLTLSSVRPIRAGYAFLGWSTSSTATYATYSSGEVFTGNYSLMLYAVWARETSSYTVSYNANGGSGAPASQTKTENVNLYLSSVVPTRQNYTFLGWTTSASSSTVVYVPGDLYTANASVTLYAVWSYSPASYTVRYNANGGSGAPASQTKTNDVSLTLSATIPTRARYTFLGWSTNSNATTAEYLSGSVYTGNADLTLYAVWEKDNYEFSVSDLTIQEENIFRYGTATIKVRTDNWDRDNAYSNISVQLYYDGRLLKTQYVNFTAYGVAYVTFTVNVGDTAGEHRIEVRVNWDDRGYETNSENNSVSATLTVKDYEHEMSAHPVAPVDKYIEGMSVISSFTLDNDSDIDITPDNNVRAFFTVYYYGGTEKVVVCTMTWERIVIPSGGTNLVYFKWTVPEGLAGKTLYCECIVNDDFALDEENRDNNTATISNDVITLANSQTPDTRFEGTKPSSYHDTLTPSSRSESATWTMWEYENGEFVLKKYGIQISLDSPAVTPSDDCKTAIFEDGKWKMRSGYGITMNYTPGISTVSGYNRPDSNAYTSVQYAVATFPEFRYYDTNGNCRTLQSVDGSYQFVENPNADGNARVHFVPVYVNDGSYAVSVTATQMWTPAGMITAVRNVSVVIDGTIYDDWYQG